MGKLSKADIVCDVFIFLEVKALKAFIVGKLLGKMHKAKIRKLVFA
jgi:hypothetical protein